MVKNSWHIINGDSKNVLSTLPSQSVDCIITSPPYFRQREYGVDGQAGKETTLTEYVDNLVEIFREAKNVLKDNGTLWLNLGDTYNGHKGSNRHEKTKYRESIYSSGLQIIEKGLGLICKDMKYKDLIGVPWEVAFALRKDGWYFRSDIVWHRPNANAESVVDRPTRAHEFLFLFSKSQTYYYDAESIKEPCADGKGLKNKRDVWTIPIQHFRGSKHPAPFPELLVKPCLLAGCPQNGTVLDPFAGSGTVGVVAYPYNRKFLGIEINPDYIDLAKERMLKAYSSTMSLDYENII